MMVSETELPGYYFDQEKNRYFPIKGPIPGSSKTKKITNLKSPQPSSSQVYYIIYII